MKRLSPRTYYRHRAGSQFVEYRELGTIHGNWISLVAERTWPGTVQVSRSRVKAYSYHTSRAAGTENPHHSCVSCLPCSRHRKPASLLCALPAFTLTCAVTPAPSIRYTLPLLPPPPILRMAIIAIRYSLTGTIRMHSGAVLPGLHSSPRHPPHPACRARNA